MSFEQTSKFEFQTSLEREQTGLLSTASLADLRATIGHDSEMKSPPNSFPDLQINENMLCCAKDDSPRAKEASESREEKQDKAIKDCFGADVFEHLKDQDWLIDHRKELEEGFKKAAHQGQDKLWEIARRMSDLSKVDGRSLIYLSKIDGHTAGSLIPKRYDIYLRRGNLRSDNLLGWVHH